MPARRLTKRIIDQLAPRAVEYTAWDSELRGFGVRVRPSGAKTYIVRYRPGGGRSAPIRRMTVTVVGAHGITPEQARAQAKALLAAAIQGGDPARERSDRRRAESLGELFEAFLARHVRTKCKPITADRYVTVFKKHVAPVLGRARARDVTRWEVARLHHAMRGIPAQANQMIAVVRAVYAWAGRQGFVLESVNPARGVEMYREHQRERYLTGDELGRLGAALSEAESGGVPYRIDEMKATSKHAAKPENRLTPIGPHAAAAIRLLLFTGCRLREILHLRWATIDFERGLLFLPDSKTGRKTVVLNTPALAVLSAVPRMSDFVIAGDDPEKPRADLKRPWRLITRHAQLEGLRIHDLRHSFASIGAGSGLGLPIVGKLLGHANASTTERYAHVDADPLRRTSDRIGGMIAAALEGKPKADIVPFRKEGAS